MKLYQLIWRLLKGWRHWNKEVNLVRLFETLTDDCPRLTILEITKVLMTKGLKEDDLHAIDHSLWLHRFEESINNPTEKQITRNKYLAGIGRKIAPITLSAKQMKQHEEWLESIKKAYMADPEYLKHQVHDANMWLAEVMRNENERRINSSSFDKVLFAQGQLKAQQLKERNERDKRRAEEEAQRIKDRAAKAPPHTNKINPDDAVEEIFSQNELTDIVRDLHLDTPIEIVQLVKKKAPAKKKPVKKATKKKK